MDRERRDAGRLDAENDIEKQAQHLAELMRSGEIEREKVAFMAFLGHEPAMQVIPENEVYKPKPPAEMTRDERREFCREIRTQFGDSAFVSLFLEPAKVLEEVTEQVLDGQGITKNHAPGAFMQLMFFLDHGHRKKFDEHDHEDIHDERDVYEGNFVERVHEVPLPGAEYIDFSEGYMDAHYGYPPILLSFIPYNMLTENLEWEDILNKVVHYLSPVEGHPMSKELLDSLSEGFLSKFAYLGHEPKDEEERSEMIKKSMNLLLSMMKQSGLNWALKDVK